MNMTHKDFSKHLSLIKDQIFDRIREVMNEIGPKVCVRMYQEYDLTDMHYTYFEVDGDGYGRELFIDTVVLKPSDDISILLHDTEDCYEPVWDLEDLTVTDANYLLEELEDIAQFHEDNPDKEILKEYDEDFDWEGYLAR